MSKIPIDCLKCGGTHEDNPSGRLRHARTLKHRSAMAKAFAAIDPAKPILIPGGHPMTQSEQEGRHKVSQLGLAIAQAEVDLEKAQHDLDYRNNPKHLHQYGDRSRQNFRDKIAKLFYQIRDFDTERAAILLGVEALKLARDAADREMYAAVELYVTTLFSGDSAIWIRRNGAAGFIVAGTTGKVLSNDEGDEWPETRFGHEATVYGPDLGWYNDEGRPVKSAYVSWGSKQMDTIEEAERLIGIYLTATAVARLLNELAEIKS